MEKAKVGLGDLSKTREELSTINAEVEIQLAIDEVAFATKIAGAIGNHFQGMLEVIEAKFETEKGKAQTGQMVRQTAGGV